MTIRFHQSCPTCGRRMDIRASLMGRTVACQHCSAEFIANPSQGGPPQRSVCEDLMSRAEAALQRADEFKGQTASMTEH
ncbi:MAG: response regulator [Planctomycetota bacterium]